MKISIIIPIYNVELYLEQCLNSIINQSYSNLEIILVNDGSQDQSAKICDEFGAKDSRIKVIHQLNAGVSSARNSGIKVATGDYITFVDSDDWLEKETYQKMIEVVISHKNPELLMCDFINEKNDDEEKISTEIREGFYTKKEIIKELYPTLLVTENFGRIPIISACICLFKKELLLCNRINFDVNLKYAEDYLFMSEIILNTDSFYYLKNCYFYHYRQYDQSRSKRYQQEWWNNFLSLNYKLRSVLSENKDYDFSRQLKLQLIHSALFLSSTIFQDYELKTREKLILLRKLYNDSVLEAAFYKLKFFRQPFALKVVLYFVKYKMVRSYLIYNFFISKIKKM